MRNLLYIMNVDWNWIKQRPHFIAEGLSEKFNIHVMYQYRYSRKGLQKANREHFVIKPIYVIPRGDRYYLTARLNTVIKKFAIKNMIKKIKPKIIYLTFPDQIKFIPNNYTGKVIYDCMDNHLAFIHDLNKKKEILGYEKQLAECATIILTSSEKLQTVLKERYGENIGNKICLVRNGYNGKIIDLKSVHNETTDVFTITYFGTISKWFNFEYIMKSLEDFPNIKYELFGPVDGTQIPIHNRLIYKGTVEHDMLQESTGNADCFVMPFLVNEIIESVDPVKLYEYINFNKNILCPFYPEIERFREFVHFYTDYKSYKMQLEILQNDNAVSYSELQRKAFLAKNQWSTRVDAIINCIESI